MRRAIVLVLVLAACGTPPDQTEPVHTPAIEQTAPDTIPAYAPRLTRPAGGLIAGEQVIETDGCWRSPSWSLRQDGQQLLVAKGASCASTASSAHLVRTLAEDEFFLGLHRDLLVLDRGTAPDGRELVVVNLESGATLYDGPYQHDEVHVSGRIVIFHTPIDPLDDAVCAEDYQAQGFGVGYEQVNGLDMLTGELSPMRGISCSPRQ